jgi:hypothetical protein
VGGNLRSWPKGVSGNPKGRPPGPHIDLVKQCRSLTPQLVDRLVLLTTHRDPRVALQAIVYVLDRGWGKPRQALDVEGGPPVILASALEDARQLFDERMARLQAAVARDGQASVLSHPVEAERPASSGNDGASEGPQAASKSAAETLDEKFKRYFGTDGRDSP